MSQPHDNDRHLDPGFIEWIDEIIDCNLSLSIEELRKYIHKTTGEDFTEAYLEQQRKRVSAAINRADRYPEPEGHPLWGSGQF